MFIVVSSLKDPMPRTGTLRNKSDGDGCTEEGLSGEEVWPLGLEDRARPDLEGCKVAMGRGWSAEAGVRGFEFRPCHEDHGFFHKRGQSREAGCMHGTIQRHSAVLGLQETLKHLSTSALCHPTARP